MCGIAGALVWGREPAEVTESCVARMVTALDHRGPDGRGIRVCPRAADATGPTVVLGHTRLAIIDLSARAAQPMTLPDAPISVTFNGEIYNFAALRAELAGRGHVFQSDSDTEVLLHGYREWGDDLVNRLRGMFAFGLWDGARRRLLLARDRFGIKPVYVYRSHDRLLFASEIRALLASGDVPRRLDPIGLDQYLAYQTVPAPRTLVDGVSLLEPGHRLTMDADGHAGSGEYWDLLRAADARREQHAGRDASVDVGHVLLESAALHLISDVPVGLFLSGGLDSSALTLLVRRTGVTPRTFAVGFPGTAFDESDHAREVARAIGSDHTEIALQRYGSPRRAARSARQHGPSERRRHQHLRRVPRRSGTGHQGRALGTGRRRTVRRISVVRTAPAALALVAHVAPVAGAGCEPRPPPWRSRMGNSSIAATKVANLLESDGSLAETFPVMRQMFSPRQRRTLVSDTMVRAAQGEVDPYVALLGGALDAGSRSRTHVAHLICRGADVHARRAAAAIRIR